ncbi:MAG: alkaline phosphatase family protein [Phycisphaerae bacterium]|nr:alkaline phosphatase family protein [Phycisphaerae bacterium]NUQ45918.1 alkaline phosphatase family protein [Phycisphaerae bacterium]
MMPACLSLFLLCTTAHAQATRPAAASSPSRPRLIVLIVVDQLRGDFPDRYAAHFGEGGFRRLMREGAHFVSAHFSHAATATGPGHACVACGCNPREHGVAANRDGDGECSEDPKHPLVGLDDPRRGASGGGPHRLQAPALGDVMKLATAGQARVVSLGLKRRGAIMLGGLRPDTAIWWHTSSGRFVTSTAYATQLSEYAAAMNAARAADRWFGRAWERLLPPEAYRACVPDDDPAEADAHHWGRAFPHPLTGGLKSPGEGYYAALLASPFANELLLELARAAVEYEKLGQDDVCDLLCIALSSNDVCGHLFGPDSHEVMDITLRTDRQLAELFSFLDARLGAGRYIAAVTGDHGVAPIAAHSRAHGLDAGCFSEDDAARALNVSLQQSLDVTGPRAPLVKLVELPWLFLEHETIRRAELSPQRVVDACVDELMKMKGVAWVVPAARLAGPLPADADERFHLAREAYHPRTAGDIYIGLRHYWQESENTAGHGTAHAYDRHVPILLYGPGVRAGRYATEADPIDIAVTLARLIGIQPAPTMVRARNSMATAVE